jgi:hypothetical protein
LNLKPPTGSPKYLLLGHPLEDINEAVAAQFVLQNGIAAESCIYDLHHAIIIWLYVEQFFPPFVGMRNISVHNIADGGLSLECGIH